LEGGLWDSEEGMGEAFSGYFQQLFSTACSVERDTCLEAVNPKVTTEMNSILLRDFSPEEVDQAISQMHPLKAPCPDGYGACFFRNTGV